MTHVINDECIACGACEPECPENAISEGDDKFNIAPEKCSDCGACVEVCPVEAIHKGKDK
ncbi:MAG: 4Fe-4S binding protein [Dethiobacter sp.]|nr:4Fe-4S binding protein [Dethiobacter sp.]MCL5981872.1 4Fe-4S binding protein [Bacillota bacterium]